MPDILKDKEPLIHDAFLSLYHYCQKQNYKGWDNFDGLKSEIFRNTPFYKSAFLRLAWIQFFKRSPVNFRKITRVPRDYNPKGLALFVSGLVCCGKHAEAESLINRLRDMTCPGYETACWGYNFDWQSKLFLTPAGTPNIVTTVFVANAFLDYFDKTKDRTCLDMAISGCEFFLRHLILFEDRDTLCFGYMPGSNARVHNVNMLAASLLARVYQITGYLNYYKKSRKAMTYAVNALNPDYSWTYGEHKLGQFIDNFHTGFNIVSLSNWMESVGKHIWEEELRNSYDYFLKTFWLDNGCPKYYHNSLCPIDIHGSAQGIITCLKMAKYDNQSILRAKKIARWAVDNMQDKTGYFYYQKNRWYRNRIPYIRWSQAWMFYALAAFGKGAFITWGIGF